MNPNHPGEESAPTATDLSFSLLFAIAYPPPPIDQPTTITTASRSHSSEGFDHRSHHRVLFRRRARLLFCRRYSPP
ncbi:hypothetical protein HN51_014998, partial [Arachis hypogaea]